MKPTRSDLPLGRLIERYRKRIPGMSQNKAGPLAGITGTGWRRIVYGLSAARPETVARMALVVHVTPKQLSKLGYLEAANELVKLRGDDPEVREDTVLGVLMALVDLKAAYGSAVFDAAFRFLGVDVPPLAPPPHNPRSRLEMRRAIDERT